MERKELHRRVELLRAKLQEGKLHIAPHLANDFRSSFNRIRISADGLVDEDSVDSRIRALLTFIAYQADREEWKEVVSLQQIQTAYFDRVEQMFGQPFQMMLEFNVDPYRFSNWFASDSGRVKDAIRTIDEFVSDILEFWENIAEPTWIHLEDSLDSKAVFTGELFPDGKSNVVSSIGIYFDTTILPDPFVKISSLLSHMDESERTEEVLRLGLQVLQYRQLAVAELDRPLVAILPDRHRFEEGYREFIHECAETAAVQHASRLFGQSFAEAAELRAHLQSYPSSDALVAKLVRPEELVFATEWSGSLASHIERYLAESGKTLGITTPGDAVFLQLISRFSQANDSYQRSRDLRGTPIVRAETSWLWFTWMLRNNAKNVESEALTDLHISRALGTTIQREISWLGNVPPSALIEMRRTGAVDEIRALLRSGVQDLITARPDNFHRTGDRVFENLREGFAEHEKALNALRAKKWKFAGLDIGSFVVVGGIEMAAAFTGLPLYGAAAAAASLSGVIPTAKELKERLAKLREESQRANSTGLGILFRYSR